MNNDLLNYSSKNPKKIEKSNTFSKNNEIRINSKNKNNFDTYESKKESNKSQEKKKISENKNSNKKENNNKNFLNDYYSNEDAKYINKGQNMYTVNDILGEDIKREININIMDVDFKNYFPGKVSRKSYGPIKAYAANTNQGITRDYNEDRVSIIININRNLSNKCKEKKEWPKASYFSVFDGHGGNKCAEFLKNNLLTFICESKYYPSNIEKAIKYGFNEADKIFLKLVEQDDEIIDNSGSCGLILLVFENQIYIANVGDSRCVISLNNGKIRKDVTRDHKPNYPYEKERIISNGGKVYQTQTYLNQNGDSSEPIDNDDVSNTEKNTNIILLGPYRVVPGNLSVSRTIGDPAAKLPEYGGNEKVIISEPDVYSFDLNKDDIDFLILGCDGIYDQLTSKEILECAWMMIENNKKIKDKKKEVDIYNTCSNIVDFILKMSMARKSFDNVTCVIVAFKDLLNDDNSESDDNIIYPKKKEENKNENNIEEKLPNLVKNKTITSLENNLESKKKIHLDGKIQLKDVDKNNNKMSNINIKNLKINNRLESRNGNNLNSEDLDQINTNNGLKSKESKINENDTNDFFKYKHKLALSLKKLKQNKKYELEYDINNNYLSNKNSGNSSLKKAKINLNLTKNFLNNKIKPIVIENKFLLNNKSRNNLTMKLNSFKTSSEHNNIKTENFFRKSPTNNNELNFIQNYNTKEKNLFFHKPHLNNINNLNIKTKDKLFLNDLLTSDQEHKNNKNIRLKTMNKKSISFYNNALDDLFKKKKNENKHSFQKNKRSKYELYNIKAINGRNNFNELKGQNTANLNNNININLFHSSNGEKIKLTFKPGFKNKNLIHNLTEDFLVDNKRVEIPNINQKNKVN